MPVTSGRLKIASEAFKGEPGKQSISGIMLRMIVRRSE